MKKCKYCYIDLPCKDCPIKPQTFFQFAKKQGFKFALKYRLGIAKEGIDFTTEGIENIHD